MDVESAPFRHPFGPPRAMEAASIAVGDAVAVLADEEQLRGLVTGHPSLCWSTACEKLLGSQGSLVAPSRVIHVLLIVFSHIWRIYGV